MGEIHRTKDIVVWCVKESERYLAQGECSRGLNRICMACDWYGNISRGDKDLRKWIENTAEFYLLMIKGEERANNLQKSLDNLGS